LKREEEERDEEMEEGHWRLKSIIRPRSARGVFIIRVVEERETMHRFNVNDVNVAHSFADVRHLMLLLTKDPRNPWGVSSLISSLFSHCTHTHTHPFEDAAANGRRRK
jgi:hypothetical protein